jgi:hypothetical protein
MTHLPAGPARRRWMAPLGFAAAGPLPAPCALSLRFVPGCLACPDSGGPAALDVTYEAAVGHAAR